MTTTTAKQKTQMAATFTKGKKSFGQTISRLFISLVIITILGITTSFPANAEGTTSNYVSPDASISPIFNPKEVRLGITPTGWSNSDDLTIDLNPPISYKQIISEIALSGFKGLQGAPKFPQDTATLKKDLEARGLTISEPWVGTYFTIGAKKESQKIFKTQMKFMKNFDSNVIVVAELGGAVHQQPIEPLENRPKFNKKEWELLIDGLNDLGDKANAEDMVLCYHPHVGTGVETRADIDRLMEGTKDHHVNLLIDTGHLYYVGVSQEEILKLIQDYGDRIKHVHLKNIRQDVLEKAKEETLSFLDAIRAGVFTVPGDKIGIIDFNAIFNKLAAVNYQGWLIVEAEQDPRNKDICPFAFDGVKALNPPCEPLDYAQVAKRYLNQFFFQPKAVSFKSSFFEEGKKLTKDQRKIKRVFEKVYPRNVRNKDVEAFGKMYTKNALWMPPNDPDRFGIADIKEGFAQTVENQSIDPIFTAQQIKVTNKGNDGYVVGISNADIYPDNGEPEKAKYRALWVMKKVDEKWLIDRQIWNNKPVVD